MRLNDESEIQSMQIGSDFSQEAQCAALEAIGADLSQVLQGPGLRLEMVGDGQAWLRWSNRRTLSPDEVATFLGTLRDYRVSEETR